MFFFTRIYAKAGNTTFCQTHKSTFRQETRRTSAIPFSDAVLTEMFLFILIAEIL